MVRTDTIRDTLTVTIPAVVHDTVVLKSDTITLQKNNWRVKIVTIMDSVYVTGGCDSVTVYVPIEVPCETIGATTFKRMPLRWWEWILYVLGGLFIAQVVFRWSTTSRD